MYNSNIKMYNLIIFFNFNLIGNIFIILQNYINYHDYLSTSYVFRGARAPRGKFWRAF